MAHSIPKNPSAAPARERRRSDRRTRPSLWNRYHWFGGRRRYRRRAWDGNRYVDHYGPDVVAATVGLLLLSATDATLTLNLLRQGAVELNPLMHTLIEQDPALFALSKLGMTAVAAFVLAVHHPFRLFGRIPVLGILHTLAFLYLVLVVYEVALHVWI